MAQPTPGQVPRDMLRKAASGGDNPVIWTDPLGVLTGTLTRFQAPCRQSPSRPCWARDVVLEPFPGLFLERPAHEAFFHPVDVAAQSGLHLDAILEKLVSKAGRYPLIVVDERQSLKEDGGTASASVAL